LRIWEGYLFRTTESDSGKKSLDTFDFGNKEFGIWVPDLGGIFKNWADIGFEGSGPCFEVGSMEYS